MYFTFFYLSLSSYLSNNFFPQEIFIYFTPLRLMLLRSPKCQISKISALAEGREFRSLYCGKILPPASKAAWASDTLLHPVPQLLRSHENPAQQSSIPREGPLAGCFLHGPCSEVAYREGWCSCRSPLLPRCNLLPPLAVLQCPLQRAKQS